MQLLDKFTIAKEKSFERKLEIDEGAKLALKIDTLRRTAAEEETKLSQFREKSMAQIKSDIGLSSEKLTSLRAEITVAENRLAEVRVPLDQEWARLNDDKRVYEIAEEELGEKIEQFLASERDQVVRLNQIKVDEERAAEKLEQGNEHIKTALRVEEHAKGLLNESLSMATKIMEEANNREAETVSRENTVAESEHVIMTQKKLLDDREKQLNSRERAINDKYQTLLRSTNRIKNG